MATEAPDPRSFQTWEDAFQYPIPVVRKLEQQLRNNADENREKLRSLVGYGYLNTGKKQLKSSNTNHTQDKLPQPPRYCRNDHRYGSTNGPSGNQAFKNRAELQLEALGEDVK